MRRATTLVTILASGCLAADEAPQTVQAEKAAVAEAAEDMAFGSGRGGGGAMPGSPSPSRKRKEAKRRPAKGNIALGDAALEGALGALADEAEAPMDGDDAEAAAPARAWFPETFLFEPAVITDAEGRAALDVKVPDRLTTWRMLALAHSREGAQAGAVARVSSTLPLYVDPVVPAFLRVGDEAEIPVQVVNTTDVDVRARVRVQVEGAELLAGGGAVVVPGLGSVVQAVRLRARRPGTARLTVSVAGRDAVVKAIPVEALGRPWSARRGGTLASARTIELDAPDEIEPHSAQVRWQVFPGALALLRSELGAARARVGAGHDGYALLLAGRAPALAASLGGEVDADALRRLGLVAGQRVLRAARAPRPEAAALWAEAALAHPDNPVLARLGARLARQVANAQRPDGTMGGGQGWALPRLLVATAEGVAAVRAGARGDDASARQRAEIVALRASGAFERYRARVDDAYTAAWAVASGAVQGEAAAAFRARVRAAVSEPEDGQRWVDAPKGALRADGTRPSAVECTAMAVLALLEDPEAAALIPDLGAALLAAYRPGQGWGDGRANLAALRAVLAVFADPIPDDVQLELRRGDEVVARGALTGRARAEVFARTVALPSLRADETFTLSATPPVPGLGFDLALSANVPWDDSARSPGLELAVDVGRDARVGRPVDVTVRATAPARLGLEVRHALPAGVQADTASLSRLVTSGALQRFEVEDGRVTLYAAPRAAGQLFSATYQVIPTLAGRLWAGASEVTSTGRSEVRTFAPPSVWSVR